MGNLRWDHTEPYVPFRWVHTEPSVHFRNANMEPPMHFRKANTEPSMNFRRDNTKFLSCKMLGKNLHLIEIITLWSPVCDAQPYCHPSEL